LRKSEDPIRLVVLDLDGTLTEHPSPWQYVHERLGLWDRASLHLDDFMAGKIDYHEFCQLDVEEWKPHSYKDVSDIVEEIKFKPESQEIMRELAAHEDLHLMILSSGFEQVAYKLLRNCGISNGRVKVTAQRLIDDKGRVQVDPFVILGDKMRDKRAHLQAYLEQHGLSLADTVALDDKIEDERFFSGMRRVWHIQADGDLKEALSEILENTKGK